MILFYAPSIISDSETVVQEEGRDIALSSAKSISDIAAFAELVDPQAITQPFVNYPFFTAGRFFGKLFGVKFGFSGLNVRLSSFS